MQRISVEEEFFNKSTPYLEYPRNDKTQRYILKTSYKKDPKCVRWMWLCYLFIVFYLVGFVMLLYFLRDLRQDPNSTPLHFSMSFGISSLLLGLPCLVFWRQARLITGISLQIRYRVQETLWLREDRIEDMYRHLQYMAGSSPGWFRASILYEDITKIEYNEYFNCYKLYAPVHIEYAEKLLRAVEDIGYYQNWTFFPYFNHTEELMQTISQRSGKPIVRVHDTSNNYTYDSRKPPPGPRTHPPKTPS